MTTQVQRASQRLFGPGGLGVKNIHLFPGSAPGMTAEQVAGALNDALDQIEAGNFDLVSDIDN